MSSCHAHYGTAEFCDDCIDEKTAPLEADIADWKQWHRDLARVLRLDIVEKTVTYKSAARTKSERDDFSAQIAALTADLVAAKAENRKLKDELLEETRELIDTRAALAAASAGGE